MDALTHACPHDPIQNGTTVVHHQVSHEAPNAVDARCKSLWIIPLYADVGIQSSQIVSRSKSARLSPPQILHLFLFLSPALPKPKPAPGRGPGVSRLLRRGLISPLSFLNLAARSASTASHSRSGASSIVSSEDTLGERERVDVGVEGMLEKDELLPEWWRAGKPSLKRAGASEGEDAEDEKLELVLGVPDVMPRLCRGEVGLCRRPASVRAELREL